MKPLKKIKYALLLERIRRGDKDAFAVIFDEYQPKIFRYIYFKVPRIETCEDLVSEVFLKFWQAVYHDQRQVDNLQAFIYRIAHNTVVDFYRLRRQEVDLSQLVELADENSEKIVAQINIDQDIKELLKVLTDLPTDQAEIITLHYIEELSVKEIAKITGKKENNVRVILHRAIKALKEKLN